MTDQDRAWWRETCAQAGQVTPAAAAAMLAGPLDAQLAPIAAEVDAETFAAVSAMVRAMFQRRVSGLSATPPL